MLEYDRPSIVVAWADGGTVTDYVKKFPDSDLKRIVRGYSFFVIMLI